LCETDNILYSVNIFKQTVGFGKDDVFKQQILFISKSELSIHHYCHVYERKSLLIIGSTLNSALFYFIFSVFIVIVFVWKFIPETNGKTLEEMETLFEAK